MAIIHILDKHTAELIAAGEVVERPASVVKELLENAIDAKSTSITVKIERGGISFIEIQDNGLGIEPDEVPKAFIRHATSKIETGNDLNAISTLGFRGEALASIAAVSKTTLLTKTESSEYAAVYRIEGGEEIYFDAAARPIGTTVTVQDLFYNTPARMKFLKKDQSEANLVQDVVLHLALSHPEISFRFFKDQKEQFFTPGNGDLLATIYALQGADYAKNMLPVSLQENNLTVTGFVTAPSVARGSRNMQHFYVNSRYIKNTTMSAALEQACKGRIMVGKFPGCVLNLAVSPEKVDVNVHPAKTEVRFANSKEVFDIVYQAVTFALDGPNSSNKYIHLEKQASTDTTFPHSEKETEVKQTNFTYEKALETLKNITKTYDTTLHSTSSVPYQAEKQGFHTDFNTAMPNGSLGKEHQSPDTPHFEKDNNITSNATAFSENHTEEQLEKFEEQTEKASPLQIVGEVFKTYILAQQEDCICFIDKHAAHERILYEKLLRGLGEIASQLLLLPVNVVLSGEEKNALFQNIELVKQSGIDIDDFGGNSIAVRSVPSNVTEPEIPALIQEIAQKFIKGSKTATTEKQDWLYASIACRGAIKAGDYSNEIEMLSLAQEIIESDVPKFCPHGRPIVLKLTKKEIEKYFGRLG